MALPFDIDPQAVVTPDLDIALLAPGASPTAHDWRDNEAPYVSQGLGTDTLWFRVALHNPDPAPRRVWLEVNSASVDYATLTAGGRSLGAAGLLVPRADWPTSTPVPAFPVDLAPNSTVEVVGHVQSENERQFQVLAIGDAALPAHVARATVLHGLFYGALGFAAAIATLLAVRMRDPVYGVYALYTAALVAWMAVGDGHLTQALPALTVAAPRLIFLIPGGLSHVSAILFAALFVGSAQPRLRAALLALFAFAICTFMFVSSPILPWHEANAIVFVAATIDLVLIASATLIAWRRGVRGAQWIGVGWFGFAIFMGSGLIALLLGAALPVSPFDLLRAGATWELFGFSMALAARLQDVMAQRDAASASALAANRLGRYFPKALVQRILASEDEAVVKSERVLITVMFSDLRGFTDLSDRTSPERVTSLLNEFLAAVVPIIERNGGAVDKMMGDGLMVLFGTPTARPPAEQAQGAVDAAIQMHAALAVLGDRWRAEGLDHDVLMRVGIHQDYVTVGNFGTAELMSRTAIGGGVNLAARLENGCTPGRILASFPVVTLTKGFAWGPFDERTYKGIVRPQKVAELDPTAAC